jgi:RNA polymerase sigma factor (sigma-70 family)
VEASALSHPVGLGRVSLAGPLLRLRSDDQLVALFREGHDEAFQTIHDRYRSRLFAYARQMLGGSRSDAEDVLQDVFLRAYNSLRDDRRDVALRAWLYRVAHNRCIDQLRRPTPAAEDIYDINRGVSTDLLAEAERREDLRRLIADVRELPEQQRSALLMREMEGLSYNDLAAALGVTVPAIKSLLVRARVGLVEAIEARDTACTDIRHDIASAIDRGVRANGRARKHLRECVGCQEYRSALKGVDKALNGLAFPAGPLTTIMKILGLGGAGSGAAAGGGAVAAGGGGAGVATTVGGGAVAATATKVVAVVAAAAVVGGGAATVEKQVSHRQVHASKGSAVTRTHAPARAVAAPIVAPTQRRQDGADGTTKSAAAGAPAGAKADHGATRAPHVTKLREDATVGPAVSAGLDVPKVEETTGGVVAPDDTAADTPSDPSATDPGGSGTATAGTGTGTGAATTVTDATTTTTSTGQATSTSSSSTTSSGGTPTPGTTAPSGATSETPTAPLAQGASAPPAAG